MPVHISATTLERVRRDCTVNRRENVMHNGRNQSHGLGALLLLGSVTTVPVGYFFPGLAWLVAAAILAAASVLILMVGIRRFMAICFVTVAHFFLAGPPPPYGRGDLPLDYVLACVVLPLTLAAASIGVWHWSNPVRR
jgi:hypothetical protein